MTKISLAPTQRWMYRNARPLDLARWRFHFEDGSKEDVLAALAAHQNEDGGFGHGLEPDTFNPNSSPLQTQFACEVLYELGEIDPSHPIITGIIRYLDSGVDYKDGKWADSIPTHNDHPHAPWWHYNLENPDKVYNPINPTAHLAGFMIKYSRPSSTAHKAREIVADVASYQPEHRYSEHHLHCVLRMYQLCVSCGQAEICAPIDESMLRELALQDLAIVNDYLVVAGLNLRLIDYADDTTIQQYADYIIPKPRPDGTWNIAWSWDDPAWAVAESWWRGYSAVDTCVFLRRAGYSLCRCISALLE